MAGILCGVAPTSVKFKLDAQAVKTHIQIIIGLVILMERSKSNISSAANLRIGCWNPNGLTKVKSDLLSDLKLDIACISETHGLCDADQFGIFSEKPSKSDKYSGVGLLINNRLSSYIMDSGSIGSRIVFCKLRGIFFNIVVVGVYIPQKKRKKPDQKDIYDKLETFLMKLSDRDCIILLGDFNSRLPRDTEGRVGHWCIHKNSDSGGDRLLEIMNRRSLRCISTYFQPRRNHSNATYINVQPEKAPSQIDYIIVSSRWSSSARSCSTKWGISIASTIMDLW